jgi:uncharacterized C2H2 Zn-finger protein
MPESTRVAECPACGEIFTTRKLNVKFCSVKCSTADRVAKNRLRRQGPERFLVCPVCSIEFATHKINQKFCSQVCSVTNNRAETAAKREAAKIKSRECLGCGNAFEPVGRQRFCTLRCGKRIQARNRLGLVGPELRRPCWWCHEEFFATDGRKLYCSDHCAAFVKSLWNVSKYGITRDDYRDSWYRQNGVCAVCKQPERTARNHLLSVDHDHETGRFRGLLCSHCNRAIGLLQDDPAVIIAAANYLLEGAI